MAWDATHILLTMSADAIVVATAVTFAQAIVVDFILWGALPGVSDFNFAFDTP